MRRPGDPERGGPESLATSGRCVHKAAVVVGGSSLFVALLLGLYVNLRILLRVWNEPDISFRCYLMMLVGK
jgi:hypothetical protein